MASSFRLDALGLFHGRSVVLALGAQRLELLQLLLCSGVRWCRCPASHAVPEAWEAEVEGSFFEADSVRVRSGSEACAVLLPQSMVMSLGF